MFEIWNVVDVGCCGCGMFGMWDVWDMGCGMWNVYRDVGCLFAKCSPNTVYFVYFCIFDSSAVKTFVRKVNQTTRRCSLVKTNSSLIGDLIFMLNTDWMTKKQLNIDSINHFYK